MLKCSMSWFGTLALAVTISAARIDANSNPTTFPTSAVTSTAESPTDNNTSAVSFKDGLLGGLPPVIGDELDFNLWGWLGGTYTDQSDYRDYYDAVVALGITKSFNERVSISGQGDFIDANGTIRGELAQAYVSAVLNEKDGAYITIGKFNANFGTEARDFWNRTTGTTSVLFGAQPQDIVGGMITVPLGQTGVTLRPFLSGDFQGQFDFNQSPAGGMEIEYQPVHGVKIAVTNWVGSGYVTVGGHSIQSPYPLGVYGLNGPPTTNWQGPNLVAERGGTLYFFEAKATWQISPDLGAAAEILQGTSGTRLGRWGWNGMMTQIDYDLTDKWRIFGRFSYLDDSDGLITGTSEYMYEYSIGTAYQLYEGVEVRAEYRHDKSNSGGDDNGVSLHLALTF